MLEDTRLSWRAKGLLCYMLSRPDNWKINKTDIYKRATEGRDAMQAALVELKELDYLHVYRNVLENGQFSGWIWEYDDMPFTPDILENRTTEKPQENDQFQANSRTTENPYFGKPVLRDSSTYNNTDYNNTDFNNTKKDKELLKDMSISPKKPAQFSLEKEFEQLWKIYPRKIGKKKAFDSYKKARKIKKIPYETIEKGLYRYVRYLEQQETDEQFIQHGSTWFNGEKWQDEYISTVTNKKPKNATEYLKAKYGGNNYGPYGNGEIIEHHPEVIPEFF